MRDVLVVVVVGVAMFTLRTSFIVLAGHRTMPPLLARALDHMKPAALGALAAATLVAHEGVGPAHVVALTLIVVLTRRGVDMTLALLAGMILVTLSGLIT